jgi:hypothetical protein
MEGWSTPLPDRRLGEHRIQVVEKLKWTSQKRAACSPKSICRAETRTL